MSFVSLMRALALGGAALLASAFAQAQAYPNKPIRLIVGFGAGGGTDTIARVYAQKLQEVLKTSIVVENKPGASETLAAQSIATSPPDGYTIWLGGPMALITTPSIREVPYDPVRAFTFINKIAEADAVFVVRKDLPINSLADLVKHAKDNPGKLTYAHAGIGSPNHLIPEYLLSLVGAKATSVPYKSDAEVVREVAAGTVDFGLPVAPIGAPFVNDGRVKGIAVTAPERLKGMPAVRSVMEETIPEAKVLGTYAFFVFAAPAGLPPQVAQTLSDAFATVTKLPDVRERLEGLSYRPVLGPGSEIQQKIQQDVPKWRDVAKKAGVTGN